MHGPRQLEPIRVLVVDDFPSFRSLAREVLETDGFEIVGEAGDGRTAIEACRLISPDVVLLDVRLPDMDGFEVAEALATGGGPPILILLSTLDTLDVEPHLLRGTVAGFIPKNELSPEAVRRFLDEPALRSA